MADPTEATPLLPPASTPSSAPRATRAQSSWLSRNVRKLSTKLPAVSSITWKQAWQEAISFLKDPANLALTVWMILSVPDCVLIVLLQLGYLNGALPEQTEREMWEESATQFCNALFVLMCLIVFPLLCRHTFLLWRWQPKDKFELREAFCKNGKRKPNDWSHIAIVVFWGQVTCWTTFAFAAIYWLWPYGTTRPHLFLQVTFILSMLAPMFSFFHLLMSPLSQDYDIVKTDDEATLRMFRRSLTFFESHREVTEAEWNGNVFPGCCQDKKVATLTCLFPCCMFGYNMERLGFGHRAVHTLVFIIVLFGPVTVFMICATSLKHMGFSGRLAYHSGLILTLLGPAYGGAWRIRVREVYKLPGEPLCGSRRLADVCVWLWCSYCALCQEVRTADSYEIEKKSFYSLSHIEEGTTVPLEEGGDSMNSIDFEDEASEAPEPQAAFQR